MDNLARKPRLTLIRGRDVVCRLDVDFIPELTKPPVGEAKCWWRCDGEYARWVTSLSIVLLVYSAALIWWMWPDNAPDVILPPPAAMVVELAPAPVAPPAPVAQPPGPERLETAPPPEPERLPEPEPEPPPVPEAPEPEVVLKPIEEPSVEDTKPVQESPPKPEEPIKEAPPEEKPASSASAPPEAPVEDDQAAAPNQGVSNPVVDRNRVLDWQSSLMMKLNEAKRYPSSARRSRHEGVAYLRFAMDREGDVLSASIERSSGYPLLDKETLALIGRAQPLPKPPEGMPGELLEFVVPVEFFLNR